MATSALAAHPRVVLCRGEPGIGKTRMAEELTGLAATRGVPVAWGPAAESSGAPPYWPWRQVLRAATANVDVAKIVDELGLTPDLVRLAPAVFDAPAVIGMTAARVRTAFGYSTRWRGC
ncbi:MAG: ATP-binding protein [Actinomycetota bacterium]|nr:ATP-binding protein [Actinomycetota bacterium]